MFDKDGKLDERSQRILSEQTIPPRYGRSPGMDCLPDLEAIKRAESDVVERVAKRIATLRMCEQQGNHVPCASCRNARGYNDDVGCITLARAAIEAI